MEIGYVCTNDDSEIAYTSPNTIIQRALEYILSEKLNTVRYMNPHIEFIAKEYAKIITPFIAQHVCAELLDFLQSRGCIVVPDSHELVFAKITTTDSDTNTDNSNGSSNSVPKKGVVEAFLGYIPHFDRRKK